MVSTGDGAATPGYEPTQQRGHAFVEYKGLTYLVGGVDHNNQPIGLSSVEVFDPTKLKWQHCKMTGEIPEIIFFSAHSIVKQHLYLFGGGFSGKRNNTLWCLDLETMRWTRVKQTNAPSPRAFGGLVSDEGERLLLYGGKDTSGHDINDLHIFSIKDGECCETASGIPPTSP